MQMISVSDEVINELRRVAMIRGLDPNAYAEELLSVSLSGKSKMNWQPKEKPFRAMQLSGAAPSGRSAEEIAAEIDAARDEWNHP